MQLLVNIDVDDLSRGVSFYTEAIGLRLDRRLFGGTVAELSGASAKIYLMLKQGGTRPSDKVSTTRDYRRHWTPVHVDFEVADIDRAVERAVSAGAIVEEIQSFDWGRQACMSDPFGHGFCLIEFTNQSYDAPE
jgi:predicted enzyme related to lactoylglutathione lyase